MDIDMVDIGGASRAGVPKIPAARDADGRDEDEGELLAQSTRVTTEVPAAVQKAVAPGAQVAYPEHHPAGSGELQLDSDGRLLVPKGKVVTKSLLERPRQVAQERQEKLEQLDALLKAEDQPAQAVARSEAGLPVIEVMFQTEIGAIVSYFHKVVQQGQWLVLVSDNRAPAQSKFIPMPKENMDGTHLTFDLVITGVDKRSSRLKATPLGIQFTVEQYDFIVMLIEE